MLEWPDADAILADFGEQLKEEGNPLVVRSRPELDAGFARARLALDYDPDLDPCQLAALMFDGIATRHALLDGNKRLGFQAAVDFLELNHTSIDAPPEEAARLCIAVVAHQRTVHDLADFFRTHSRKLTLDDFL